MKKAVAVALALLMVLLLPSCTASKTTDAPKGAQETLVTKAFKPDKSQKLSDTAVLLDVPAPAKVKAYSPVVEVTPITDNPMLYLMSVSGNINFVKRNGTLLALPADVTGYASVYAWAVDNDPEHTTPLQCYALYNKQGKMAVMRTDGTVVTDFRYDIIMGEDAPYNRANNGFVLVGSKTSQDTPMHYGLVEIQTGKEVLPPEHDNIIFFNNHIVTQDIQNHNISVYDYTQKILFTKNNAVMNSGIDIAENKGSKYIALDPITDQFYEYNSGDNLTFYPNFILVDNHNEPSSPLRVFDRDGYLLRSITANYRTYDLLQDNALLVFEQGRGTIYYPNNTYVELPFTLPEGLTYSQLSVEENGYELWLDTPQGAYVTNQYSNSGELLNSKDIPNTPQSSNEAFAALRKKEKDQQALYILEDDTGFSVHKNSGETVIEKQKYTRLWFEGNFIVAYKTDAISPNYTPKAEYASVPCRFDVYSKDGKKLAGDLFGVVRYGYFDDRVVVYKDAETCGFLNLDGGFTPIENTPKVSIRYTSG